MKICIQKRLCLGHEACYQIFELTSKTTNTYNLKSSWKTGRLITTNSSNNAIAFCINTVTKSSLCRRSWKEPWSCILRELDREARACLIVCQTQCEFWQSTTRCNTSIEREERNALRISWSYCLQWRNELLN